MAAGIFVSMRAGAFHSRLPRDFRRDKIKGAGPDGVGPFVSLTCLYAYDLSATILR